VLSTLTLQLIPQLNGLRNKCSKPFFRHGTENHRWRLHLSLDKDSPDSRSVQSVGRVMAFPEVGGLHHRYERVG